MKFFWKKLIAMGSAAVLAISCLPAVPASAEMVSWPSGPELDATTAILMDASTGAVLYEKNADQQMYPASITKIMTCLLALENCSLDESVVFSADAVYKNEGDSSHIARDVDEVMTMEETLYAVMLESANECAYAVAEHVGDGDYEAFIDMMNERARELGCTNTHFTNANGLPDEEHVTTARDMALISREAIKNSEFRKLIGTTTYVIPPTNKHSEETYLNNHNRMINSYKGPEHLYEYCIGGKTGYTQAAGNTLVSFAEKDDKLLISVVMQTTIPYDDSIALLEYGFNNFNEINVAENETRYETALDVGDEAIFDVGDFYVELDPDAEIILPDGATIQDADVELTYDSTQGDIFGTLTYTYDGREVGSAQIEVTPSSGLTYEFGEEIGGDDSGLTPTLSTADTEAEEQARSRSLSTRTKVLLVILVILVVFLILLLFLTGRRRRRRRRRRKNQYKKINNHYR